MRATPLDVSATSGRIESAPRKRRGSAARVLAALGAALTSALFAELLIRAYTHVFLVYDVEMTRYADALKVDAQDDRIAHVHAPNRTVQLMGVEVSISSDGLRDGEYPLARSEKHRLLFLGDSLTFGWGVRKEDSFEARLEEELDRRQPTEILNFGHGNYNTDQSVALFQRKGVRYRPDRVVLFYFLNDAEPTPARRDWGFLGHSRLVTLLWSRIRAVSALVSPGATFRGYYSSLYAPDAAGWLQTQQALRALQRSCDEVGAELRVVLLPELHVLKPYAFTAEHAAVARVLDDQGTPFLDLAACFADVSEPERLWVARDDAHPNALAHRRIAACSSDFIAEGL